MLNWEKELIGLYVSDHPLNPVMDVLSQAVTHYSAQLGEASPQEKVRVAGMITQIRPYQTKSGKAMAFVTLEDIQGSIELVIFPNTWQKVKSSIELERIILVEGKPAGDAGEAKVLVDQVFTDLQVVTPLTSQTSPLAGLKTAPAGKRTSGKTTVAGTPLPQPPVIEPIEEWELPDEEIPLPQDDPVVWEEEPFVPLIDSPATAASLDRGERAPSADAESEVGVPPLGEQTTPLREARTAYILPPEIEKENKEIKMLTVIFRQGEDKSRDLVRFRRIYGTLVSYPGEDRFCFQVFDKGRGYLIEFPNETTQVCAELLQRLQDFVGKENCRVEKLPIH